MVGQGEVHHDVGAETLKEGDQLLYIVGIDLRGLDGLISYCIDNSIALRAGAAGYHDFCKNIGVLRHFVRGHGSYAAGTDNKDFSHFALLFMCCGFIPVQR